MKTQKKKLFYGAGLLLLCMVLMPLTAFAAEAGEEYIPAMYATFWALVPPIVAIVLALITKEVYSSSLSEYWWAGCFIRDFLSRPRSRIFLTTALPPCFPTVTM